MVTGDKRQVAGYRKLLVWEKADQLAHKIYDVSLKFPKEELYSFNSQLRRVALSVPANIVEGHARNSKNEFRHFLSIALGSLAEVEYYLEFSLKREYISQKEFNELKSLRITCGKLLWKLYKSQ